MIGALHGIRILDLTRVLAGPYATMVLADLGADVIKIEAPETGDDARNFGPFCNGESAYFMSLNRNKRSVTLNIKKQAGKELFLKMVKKADVVIENFRPGTMQRLGLGYEVLREQNPRLVYAAVSGFGQSGPYSQRPAYDAVVQAMGGIMSITSPQPNGPPTRVGTSIGDITAGLFAAIGILAALQQRELSGCGQMVDVAMLDCQVAILENAIARYLLSGEVPRPTGNRHPSIVPFEPFATRDGQIMLAVGNDSLWAIFCKVIDFESGITDPRFKTNDLRVENYSALRDLIAGRLQKHSTADWQTLLEREGIPNGPINTIDKVLQDPQVQAREMIEEIEHPLAGVMKIPGIPIKMSKNPGSIRLPAPLLGQHTNEVLVELCQVTLHDLAILRETGVV